VHRGARVFAAWLVRPMKGAALLGAGVLSLTGLLALGGAGHAQAPAVDGTWRAVVVDGLTKTLLLLDPTNPNPVPVGPAVPGFIVEPRDSSRLLFLRSDLHSTTATIFSRSPARTISPIPLGDCFLPNVGANLGAPAEGRLGSLRAGALERLIITDVPDQLILSCRGMLVSLDLERGTAARQPAPEQTTLHLLNDERVLAVETGGRDRPFTTELGIYDARTLAVEARVRVDGSLTAPALVTGGRELVLMDIGDELAPGPTTLRYFDARTATETRTVSLGAPFRSNRLSADGRFVYATNMNRTKPKQTARELRILRADTGEVIEKVTLKEHASWGFIRDRRLPAMIEDGRFKEPASNRLLVLDEGRVRARLPIHGTVNQLSVDWERGRMYLLDERSLAVYTWPDLQLEKQVAIGKILEWNGLFSDEPFMALAPGATRALVVSGSRAVAVDLVAGTTLPETRLGSSGARARKFWANVAVAPLVILNQGPVWSTDRSPLAGSPFDPVPVAFSADGHRAMLPTSTRQITAIDMISGRALTHMPGGDGAIAFAGVPMVINADKQSSWVLNVATGDVVARFNVQAAEADAPLCASVSPDGRLVLIGRGTAVYLLEAATGRTVQQWTGFGRIGLVRFLRDVPTVNGSRPGLAQRSSRPPKPHPPG